jgi:hypothetical protein
MGFTERKGENSMNVFLDIETIPGQPEGAIKAEIAKTIEAPAAMSKPETINDWHNGSGKYAGVKDAAIEKAYRDTSFNGAIGELVSIAFAIEDRQPEVFSRADYKAGGERDILTLAFDTIYLAMKKDRHSTTPYFIGQYVAGFDLKFLFHRCVILGIQPPFSLPFSGKHGRDFYCTQEAWAGFKGRMSQDNLCKALGIAGKPDDIDGSKVWDFVKSGDVKRVAEYNCDDIEKVRAIYNRINFIAA